MRDIPIEYSTSVLLPPPYSRKYSLGSEYSSEKSTRSRRSDSEGLSEIFYFLLHLLERMFSSGRESFCSHWSVARGREPVDERMSMEGGDDALASDVHWSETGVHRRDVGCKFLLCDSTEFRCSFISRRWNEHRIVSA